MGTFPPQRFTKMANRTYNNSTLPLTTTGLNSTARAEDSFNTVMRRATDSHVFFLPAYLYDMVYLLAAIG